MTLVVSGARLTDPATSHEAAEMASAHAATNRQRALAALRAAGLSGMTDFELEAVTGIKQTSIGKRRGELRDAGLVGPLLDAAGKPVRRPAPSGAMAMVWVAI